ncbi:MarR family winged helix-turn-helix transcriptional regulator [Massilia sp. Leaf139]|uniref:MarR family winged helix-turn-helix transcriptional regulator n=1 Tax=Massilia sp. Leaf139 TaxID=1736272 RepID=UPI0006FAF4A4|nr:MarR family winged helix-turn-helix transcriptional regulator [Massilia sp. Leaf139]KQQ96549.1 MarR family transcriptional regulator [Massilia sp. Leaf139]
MATAKTPRFVFLVNRAQRAMMRWIESRPAAWDGASAAQAGLLFLLAGRGSAPDAAADAASIGEIAAALEVAPAAVTNLSKRMEATRLVERIADAHDARMTRLRLTPAGVAASLQAKTVLADLNAKLCRGFSPEELRTVARWLDHSASVLSEPDES